MPWPIAARRRAPKRPGRGGRPVGRWTEQVARARLDGAPREPFAAIRQLHAEERRGHALATVVSTGPSRASGTACVPAWRSRRIQGLRRRHVRATSFSCQDGVARRQGRLDVLVLGDGVRDGVTVDDGPPRGLVRSPGSPASIDANVGVAGRARHDRVELGVGVDERLRPASGSHSVEDAASSARSSAATLRAAMAAAAGSRIRLISTDSIEVRLHEVGSECDALEERLRLQARHVGTITTSDVKHPGGDERADRLPNGAAGRRQAVRRAPPRVAAARRDSAGLKRSSLLTWRIAASVRGAPISRMIRGHRGYRLPPAATHAGVRHPTSACPILGAQANEEDTTHGPRRPCAVSRAIGVPGDVAAGDGRHNETEVPSTARIARLDVVDVRFPTSLDLDGSDAVNVDPDYSKQPSPSRSMTLRPRAASVCRSRPDEAPRSSWLRSRRCVRSSSDGRSGSSRPASVRSAGT